MHFISHAKSAAFAAGLFFGTLVGPASAQLLTRVSDGGVQVPDGGTVTYELWAENQYPFALAPQPGGAGSTIAFSAGLAHVATSPGTDWICGAPVANQIACTYFGGIAAVGVSPSVFVTFTASIASASTSCLFVAPPCVRVDGSSPFSIAGFDETTVLGPVETHWIDPGGGSYTDPANWSLGVPDADDTALFDLDETYTVTLPAGSVLPRVRVLDGDVTLAIGSATHSAAELMLGDGLGGLVLDPVLRLDGSGEVVAAQVSLPGVDHGTLVLASGARMRAPALDVPGGTVVDVLDGALAIGSGAFPATGRLEVSADGALTLAGQIVGHLDNAGSLLLTTVFHVVPPDNVTGDFVQGPTGLLDITLHAFSAPARSPALRVAGAATLDGSLRYSGGFFDPPALLENRSLPFLYAASIAGAFTSEENATRVLGFADLATNPARLRFLEAGVCSDGLDNDLDGSVDWPADATCATPYADQSEGTRPGGGCGLGMEGALLLPGWFALRARRRRAAHAGAKAS